MRTSPSELYDEWKIELPLISPRSILYCLEPIGIGTSQVECLTSYISRLAEAHCVYPGILMQKLIAPSIRESPLINESRHRMRLRNDPQSGTFNGILSQSAIAVYALEALTQQHALRFLTLQTWKEVFPYHLLQHATRAWCPACLEEWRSRGQVIYDPLLWTFRVMTDCTQHRCKLSTHCPQIGCEREIPWLSWSSLPGYCPYCHQWLGRPASAMVEVDKDALYSQEWITEQLGTILALAPKLESPPSRTRIHAVLQHFCQQMSHGNVNAFARKLKIHETTVLYWFNRGFIPQLELLLTLCAISGVSLKACLLDEMTSLRYLPESHVPKIERTKKQHRKAPENANNQHIRHTLQMTLASDEEPPPSLKEVARRLKISPYYLRKYHLDLCEAISDRYWNFTRRYQQTMRQQKIEEVCQLAHQLVAQGERPSEKTMHKLLSKPGVLRSSLIREAWKSILREYDSKK